MQKQFGALALGLTLLLTACTFHNQPANFCTTDGRVNDVLSVGNTVFLGGEFTMVTDSLAGTFGRQGIAACHRDTGAVQPFDVGLDAGAEVYDLALSADEATLYLVGDFDHAATNRENAIAVAVADAAIDAWTPVPTVGTTKAIVRGLTGVDEQVYLGGNYGVRLYEGVAHPNAGMLDPAFSATVGGSVSALALSDDQQSLYLGGGNITAVGGQARFGAGAVNASTGSALPFAPVLADPGDDSVKIFDIVWHANQVYYCGDWWQTEGIGLADKTGIPDEDQDQRNVNRFDPSTGAADRGWWPRTDGGVQGCAIDATEDVIVLGGHFGYVNGLERDDMATLTLVGGPDLSEPAVEDWDPETVSLHGAYAVHIDTGGAAIVGGDDQLGLLANGNPALGVARFANNEFD